MKNVFLKQATESVHHVVLGRTCRWAKLAGWHLGPHVGPLGGFTSQHYRMWGYHTKPTKYTEGNFDVAASSA